MLFCEDTELLCGDIAKSRMYLLYVLVCHGVRESVLARE